MKCLILSDVRYLLANPGIRPLELAPDSAVIYRSNPWFMPEDGDSDAWQAQFFVGAVIARLGMNIAPKFANRYFNNITVATHPHNATADVSVEWSRDGSVIKGVDIPADRLTDSLAVSVDGSPAVSFAKSEITDLLEKAVCRASALVTLKTGDIVFVPVDIPPVNLSQGTDFGLFLNQSLILKFKTR